MLIPLYLFAASALTFALYGVDKRAARRKGPRVPEYILLLVGFLGGTLGAILAQLLFRHKTKKLSFRLKFWALTALQVYLVLHPPLLLQMIFMRILQGA